MRYKSFEIRNFKGIKHTKIELEPAGAKFFTLVGLNESGKTTLLEAIHSFSPDTEHQAILSDSSFAKQNKNDLIPKHRLADFSDKISVVAHVVLDQDDIAAIRTFAKSSLSAEIDTSRLPTEFRIESRLEYDASEYKKHKTMWPGNFFFLKGKGQKKYKQADSSKWQRLAVFISDRFPSIAYFPTFVFDFPKKIYLSGYEQDKRNLFYRRVFQDILDYQNEGLTIDKHVIARLQQNNLPADPLAFIASVLSTDSKTKQQIDHVMFKASAAVSKIVFEKWNEIFHDKSTIKEIIIDWQPEIDAHLELLGVDHTKTKNAFIQFSVKDGAAKYAVSERSLGFRWFFCFLLFTQLRASRKSKGPGTIFLFDEPASNLHSRAQEKLLESFPTIAEGRNCVIYSTHSPYMINPNWLEQAYIVENKAINYDAAFDASPDQAVTEVVATRYRSFVGKNPDKATYFQPILDKLDYAPSKLSIQDNSILVEGKSDFYILSYFHFIKFNRADHIYMPSSGANDLGLLIALYLGWGKRFVILLDGDKEGTKAKTKYIDEFGLPENSVVTLPEAAGRNDIVNIEDVLVAHDVSVIKQHFGISGKLSKKNIMRFFQEKLASRTDMNCSPELMEMVSKISSFLRNHIGK